MLRVDGDPAREKLGAMSVQEKLLKPAATFMNDSLSHDAVSVGKQMRDRVPLEDHAKFKIRSMRDPLAILSNPMRIVYRSSSPFATGGCCERRLLTTAARPP